MRWLISEHFFYGHSNRRFKNKSQHISPSIKCIYLAIFQFSSLCSEALTGKYNLKIQTSIKSFKLKKPKKNPDSAFLWVDGFAELTLSVGVNTSTV